MKTKKQPAVLTVRSSAQVVGQDAAVLDLAAPADVHAALRQGLDDAANGRTRPAREVFDEIRRKLRISR